MVPIVKLLRVCDSDKAAMGKIYDRMFMLKSMVQKSTASWASEAEVCIDSRWEYLHSYMHGAGYALDPEFMEHRQEWDDAVLNGVTEIIERMCLRQVLSKADNFDEARARITADSDEVVELVAECERQLSHFREGHGIFTKKNVLLNAKIMEPAAWWNQ